MKGFILCCAVVGLVFSTACASTVNLSKQGKATYYADEVTRDLGLLQQAAIEGEKAGVIKTAEAKLVVEYVVGSVHVLKTVPDGWKVTVSAGLDNLQLALSADAKNRFLPYFTTLRTLLASVS